MRPATAAFFSLDPLIVGEAEVREPDEADEADEAEINESEEEFE